MLIDVFNRVLFAESVVGIFCCCLALVTIRRAPALRNSFGVLCTWQMYGDVAQLAFISFFCLLGNLAPPDHNSLFSIIPCQIIGTLFFFSSHLHVLMAVHRFVCIVTPRWRNAWLNSTSLLLWLCAATSIAKILLMTALDTNMYWAYDRETALWFISDSPWTDFYAMYAELGCSIGEMATILVLDATSFTRLLMFDATLGNVQAPTNRRAEIRLVLQSFCQTIPTGAVALLYFLLIPVIESASIKFICSSFMLSFRNVLDAVIILAFHMRIGLFRKSVVDVTSKQTTTSTRNV